ncbi:MAG: flagellar motor switch protein FliM [Geminicoccaceae bacterium]|nr:flagellar motor switch protein FliM [Geminicoccaceae bacterium]MDW8370664.1 flagellar motor switch protein FliM [Geminicoccaceae bacterium]
MTAMHEGRDSRSTEPVVDQADLGLAWDEQARAERASSAADSRKAESEGRLVSEAELAQLLGRDRDGKMRPGVLALVESTEIAYERQPMLEAVFDRFERLLATDLRAFAGEAVDVRLEPIVARRFGDYLATLSRPSMIAVVRAEEWNEELLLVIDQRLTYAVIDLLLGGRRGPPPPRLDGRACTPIETALIERLVQRALVGLGEAFAPVTRVRFRLQRMETDPRFATITRPGNACFLVRIETAFGERAGRLELLLPHSALEPAREALSPPFTGEKFGRDPVWSSHLARVVRASELELEAVVEEPVVSLGRLLALEVGQVLQLSARPDSAVVLRCGGVPMFKGRMGRIGDRLSIRIEKRWSDEESG